MNQSFTLRVRRFWSDDGVFLALMLALFALRYWPAFAHGQLYAPFRDNVWLYGCLFSRASEIALTGQFPYWLDCALGGFSLYQTPHFSATYPFYFFGLLDYGKAIQVMYTLSYLTCLHNLILYFNLYIMLRVAGAKGLASMGGATIGLISGNTEIYAHWITIAAAFSWFPLLIAGMILLLRRPLSFWSITVFSIAAGLICTASPAQPVIESTLVCVIFFTAAAVWCWRKRGIGGVWRLLAGLAISAAVAFCLSAAAFVPMALATGGMIRAVGNHPPVIGHASIPWGSFNASQLEPHQITHVLFDSRNLLVLGGLYLGPFALLGLLLCAVAYRRSDALTRFLVLTFALMAVYFLVAAFGTHFGLAYVHFHLPLLNLIREAARYLVIFTTLSALLAGLGFQVLLDRAMGKLPLSRGWRWYFWISLGLSLLLLFVALALDRQTNATTWLILAIVPLAFLLLPSSPLRERLIISGYLLLTSLAAVLSRPETMRFSQSDYLHKDNLVSHRVLRRVAQLPDISNYRVVILDSEFKPMTWADNACFYGVKTFYLMFTPLPITQLHEMFDEKDVRFRELRGARYFICGQETKPLDPQAQLLFTESGYRIYEVPNPMGPYTLVHAVKRFPDERTFRIALKQGFDYQHVAAVWRAPRQQMPALLEKIEKQNGTEPGTDELELILRTANVFGVEVDSSRPGLLILNERWNNDWHVRVNSQPETVLRVNFVQPAVALPPGRCYIEFEYKPMLFWYLLILQRVSFVVLLLLAARNLLQKTGSPEINSGNGLSTV